MGGEGSLRELRVAFTAKDFEGSVAFYGEAFGLRTVKEWDEADKMLSSIGSHTAPTSRARSLNS